jgi:hypothetical protein
VLLVIVDGDLGHGQFLDFGSSAGLGPDGDVLTVFRSPASLLEGCPAELSFGMWGVREPLPAFDDDVTGFSLSDGLVEAPLLLDGVPVHNPSNLSFPSSSVFVPVPAAPILSASASGLSAIDNPDTNQTSPQTGGASNRPNAGESTLDEGPSDSKGADLGLSTLLRDNAKAHPHCPC